MDKSLIDFVLYLGDCCCPPAPYFNVVAKILKLPVTMSFHVNIEIGGAGCALTGVEHLLFA